MAGDAGHEVCARWAQRPTLSLPAVTRDRRLSRSVVLGAFANPGENVVAVARRQLLFAVRHAQLWRRAPIEQQHQIAALGFARDDHGSELGALHHAGIAGEIQPTFLDAFATRLMAAFAAALEDRHDILAKALLRLAGLRFGGRLRLGPSLRISGG